MNLDIDRILHPERRSARSPSHQARLVVSPDDFEATSPFLLMAEDWFSPPAGFPEHPHRGLQTVTIVLEGALEHRDHTGAHGELSAGDVQWMTAGRGVLHSEMPGPQGVHSLQLWLNLPAGEKMAGAAYRNQRARDTPVQRGPGYEVRVYAGRFGEVRHPHASLWPLTLLDVSIKQGKRVEIDVAPGERSFVYLLKGGVRFEGDDTAAAAEDVVWFAVAPDCGERVVLGVEADTPSRLLFFASPVIDEPVVAHGPFVMNTVEQVHQAYDDYRQGRLTG
ncbi:MAG: pirin family protein [Betaproteobacteria bacterium]